MVPSAFVRPRLMFATKETYVISFGLILIADFPSDFYDKKTRPGTQKRGTYQHHPADPVGNQRVLQSFGSTYALFYSSFLTNPKGIIDAIGAPKPCGSSAMGWETSNAIACLVATPRMADSDGVTHSVPGSGRLPAHRVP